MDSIILAASLISFFGLIGSWIALPSTNESTVSMPAGAPVRA